MNVELMNHYLEILATYVYDNDKAVNTQLFLYYKNFLLAVPQGQLLIIFFLFIHYRF